MNPRARGDDADRIELPTLLPCSCSPSCTSPRTRLSGSALTRTYTLWTRTPCDECQTQAGTPHAAVTRWLLHLQVSPGRAHPLPASLAHVCIRSRRVKCDVTRPECLRCTKGGRICGYADEREFSPTTSLSSMCSAVSGNGRYAIPKMLEAQRLAVLTCTSLHSGALQQGGAASSFWSFTLPQLCHTSPTVSASAAALGAAIEHRRGNAHQHRTSLGHYYGQALTAIQEALACEDPASTPLFAASLLLAMSDIVHGQELPALVHLEGSLTILVKRQQRRLLHDLDSSERQGNTEHVVSASTFAVLDEVDAAGAVVDIAAASYALDLQPRLSRLAPRPYPQANNFAYHEMYALQILQSSFSFSASSHRWKYVPPRFRPPGLKSLQGDLTDQLFRLAKDFDGLTKTCTSGESRRARYLSVQCRSCLIYVSCLFEPTEISYDRFIFDFRDIVSSAQELQDTWMPATLPGLCEFSLDLGAIQPVFFTAVKCREPRTRRSALKCLEQAHREGPFDGKDLAVVARRAIELENTTGTDSWDESEYTTHQSTPEPLRLHGAGIELNVLSEPGTNYIIAGFSRCRDVVGMMQADDATSFSDKMWWDIWNEPLRVSHD